MGPRSTPDIVGFPPVFPAQPGIGPAWVPAEVLVASAALNSDGFRFRCPLTVHLGAGSLVQGWLSSCDTVLCTAVFLGN